jgi:hypothetical protein
MTAIESTPDFDALRHRVRATQHARSVPLLVIGALLVNYGVASFAPHPVQWRYGAPLAFVVIWALGKLNETTSGVGPGRADYLVAAGIVFIATNLLLLDHALLAGVRFHSLIGAWVLIVGVALLVLSRTARDRVLLVAAVAVMLTGLVVGIFGQSDFGFSGSPLLELGHNWSTELVAAVGAVMGVTGLLLYRRERTIT